MTHSFYTTDNRRNVGIGEIIIIAFAVATVICAVHTIGIKRQIERHEHEIRNILAERIAAGHTTTNDAVWVEVTR